MTTRHETPWWRRLARRGPSASRHVPDAGDMGTCFGLEAVLQAEAEAHALRAEAAALSAQPAAEPSSAV
ncbi:hypothetical protein CKO44_04275 [Rubrivivax gelatinosus]|uniref:Uncharacterized protein n=1 Tax=Rubrivivax gelatinosus TaxID=28068 RepID=A0ABS1DT36_RUBGE|nr:hypothetical protein [Rubrivivax gelatinosus]MBK1612682.1 hypothetical protein [Rubrivivax gelatinosus]MBK1712340.1 hypothetical protein [Rubrivivax gelatinosus]